MNKVIISFILFISIFNTMLAQDADLIIPKWTLETNAGFNFSPNGNTYGLIVASNKPFWHNDKNNFSLDFGLQGQFTLSMEGGFEGTYGTTTNSGIHLLLGPSIYLFKSKRLVLKPYIYGGWSYKSTNTGINNENLNIHQTYVDNYHYLARGLFLQTGYKLNQSLILTAFVKAELRRLTNGDGILEYPGILYGIGFIKRL